MGKGELGNWVVQPYAGWSTSINPIILGVFRMS